MRIDGALEPRHGAATLQGRYIIGVAKCRREARVKCETQQQKCADEDDEAAAAAEATARDANSNSDSNSSTSRSRSRSRSNSNSNSDNNTSNCRWAAPTAASLEMREQPSLMLMESAAQRVGGSASNSRRHNRRAEQMTNMGRRLNTYVLCLISVVALLPLPLPLVLADDGDNFFAVNSFSVGPETTTPEFDYASRGQKKFGDKCENTLECGFPGSICDPKKKSCQCTEDLHVTNHIDKCGKAAAINESCFFNEQCEAVLFQTECRDGRCICRFEMSPIWGKDGSVECKGRQDKRGPETYIDPAMIGVLVGMALMFIIICVVLRLFSQARWRENRTIFNTPNPRLMNVSLLRDSKLLHGQERRGSRMSVRAPSRQPSMASLRPHSPNPSLGKTGRMIRSKSNTRSSDSRVSDVSNCSRLLEHPSAASQYNVVHSHFLPYVPTTTAASAAPAPAAAGVTTNAAPGSGSGPGPANAMPTTASGITVTTTYVSSPGTAPACGMAANKF
ncbi:hypothetical protein KR222_010805 [Zaprionus bogoriensis]|nr:hypothetical protein KR222_010805 [Zaprionus bogoriensis]